MEALPDPNAPRRPFQGRRDNPEARMTFIEHLGELRTRLVRSGMAAFAGMIVCYLLSNQIITALARPLAVLHQVEEISAPVELTDGTAVTTPTTVTPPTTAAPPSAVVPSPESLVQKAKDQPAEWVILSPIEPVLVKLKIAAYGGILLAFPYILYQFCAFIFPGLRGEEKRVIQILLAGCSVLGIAGVAVAYYGVFPLVMPHLTMFAPDFVNVQLRMNETLSLLLKGFIGFAIAFQFPMVVLVLVWMGLLTPQTLKKHRKTAIVGLLALSMVLTPPDPFSMLIMGIPLILLYEVSIWVSYLVVRRKRKQAEAA